MVSVIHRGAIKRLALAPLLGLLFTHAFALDRDRTISQFYHTAWTVREGAPGLSIPERVFCHLIASNKSGVGNEAGAALDFLPPSTFIRTVWFRVLCLIAANGFLWLLFALRLRQLTGQLRTRLAGLAERERIAGEVHDTLLQGVGGLILRFQTATERIPQDDPTRQMLEEALKQSDQVLAEGREWVLGLRIRSAEANELPQAFATVGLELKRDHPADFCVVVNGDPRELHPSVRDEVYRIGREAIANSFQHANAGRCETEINYDRRHLRISIRDDGRGVDATILDAGHRSANWGLPGMYERARKIGAHLEVWSRPGVGTEVELRIPAAIAYRGTANASRWQWLRRATGRS
jgi:signal transduction histidine kinase